MPTTPMLINTEPSNWGKFNREPLCLEHPLAQHDLFELSQLRRLAHRVIQKGGSGRVTCLIGNKGAQAGWSDWESDGSNIDYCFDHIHEPGRSYIVIYDVESDPEYDFLLTKILGEVKAGVGDLRKDKITWPSSYVFIAAPEFSTPYHIDHEIGMLLQVHGEKALYLLDPKNDENLSQRELERYYMGDLSAASYRAENEHKAFKFAMKPNTGVLFPIHAPHWVQNGPRYSVSFSINFCLESFDRRARAYQMNQLLRKLGFEPTRPGVSPVRDYIKQLPLELLSPRHPATKDEMLRSGMRRLHTLAGGVRAAMQLLTRADSPSSPRP